MADLQDLLRGNICAIDPDVLVISEEYSGWQDSRRRIDLLGIDRKGNGVVIELKRTSDGRYMDLDLHGDPLCGDGVGDEVRGGGGDLRPLLSPSQRRHPRRGSVSELRDGHRCLLFFLAASILRRTSIPLRKSLFGASSFKRVPPLPSLWGQHLTENDEW